MRQTTLLPRDSMIFLNWLWCFRVRNYWWLVFSCKLFRKKWNLFQINFDEFFSRKFWKISPSKIYENNLIFMFVEIIWMNVFWMSFDSIFKFHTLKYIFKNDVIFKYFFFNFKYIFKNSNVSKKNLFYAVLKLKKKTARFSTIKNEKLTHCKMRAAPCFF